jgi:hypothetical protein
MSNDSFFSVEAILVAAIVAIVSVVIAANLLFQSNPIPALQKAACNRSAP